MSLTSCGGGAPPSAHGAKPAFGGESSVNTSINSASAVNAPPSAHGAKPAFGGAPSSAHGAKPASGGLIVSVSRRTDVPAHYSDWFFNKLAESAVTVRNPFNPNQVKTVVLTPDAVAGFVFWSKNPAPMLPRLHLLRGYPYYFQFTLNAYKPDIEPGMPPLSERIDTFRRLSDTIGAERVIWRYDPILLNATYTENWHTESYAAIAEALKGYAVRSTISFIDIYKNIAKRMRLLGAKEPDAESMKRIAIPISSSAALAGMTVDSCAEQTDLSPFGISHGSCVSRALIDKIASASGRGASITSGDDAAITSGVDASITSGDDVAITSGNDAAITSGVDALKNASAVSKPIKKDPNQRPACGCSPSVDIGAYGTCPSGCAYCYANRGTAIKSL